MRMRKHWLMVLIVLSIPGLLWATEKPRAERTRAGAPAPRPEPVPESVREMKIFALRYQEAEEIAEIIRTLISPGEATIAEDRASQKLIVAAAPDRLQQIERVIAELDVAPFEGKDVPQMMYRIYMLELPSKHLGMRPFSIMVTGSSQLPPEQVLTAGKGSDVQIESFNQAKGEEHWHIRVAGRAASYEPIERLTKSISDCQIIELEWEDNTPVMPIIRVPPLPESLKKHIDKLLGKEVGIVGYWFGNVSVPGSVRAPIGPWSFGFEMEDSGREGELRLDFTVVEATKNSSMQILSNSLRGKIGHPVIIGYNRDNHGVGTLGALVIVPEVSPLP